MRCCRGSQVCLAPSPPGLDTPLLVVWVLGVSQADSTYLAYGKGGPKMFRAGCTVQPRLAPAVSPPWAGMFGAKGAKSLGSRRGGEHVLWQAQELKIEQNKPEIWSWGELNCLSLVQ